MYLTGEIIITRKSRSYAPGFIGVAGGLLSSLRELVVDRHSNVLDSGRRVEAHKVATLSLLGISRLDRIAKSEKHRCSHEKRRFTNSF